MKSLRILLVDDDASIGALLAEMLEAMGRYVCGIEATEARAVKAALSDRPDLMIVDARLGNGSGVAAVETICRTATIPHIFMSGGPLRTERPRAVLLQKPFMHRDLVRAIERATNATSAPLA